MQHKQTKSDITKAKILAAAEAEFSEKGYFGARVDEIALASGVNKRMIYQHFVNKEGLYKQTLILVYRKLSECEKDFFVEDLDPQLAIKNVVFAYFGFLEKNPEFVRMLMWENLNNANSLPRDEIRELKKPTIDYIREQIRRGKEQGIFKESVDEYHSVLSILNFGFAYFFNMHTLSAVMDKDMSTPSEIVKRAEFVSDLILNFLLK